MEPFIRDGWPAQSRDDRATPRRGAPVGDTTGDGGSTKGPPQSCSRAASEHTTPDASRGAARVLSEDRERPTTRERVHALLDALADFFVLRLDVGLVLGPLRVVIELDRRLEGCADLRR
jgi:hypothetical protein